MCIEYCGVPTNYQITFPCKCALCISNQPIIKEQKMTQRKYMPTLAELLDRMSICQLKEWLIPEHREEYSKEIEDIEHDIDLILEEQNVKFDARSLRALIILGQINREIWLNESEARKGNKDGNKLVLTHSLNGIRNRAKNIIQEMLGGRKDHKTDCLGSDHMNWEPSWNDKTPVLNNIDKNYYALEPLDTIVIGDKIWLEREWKDITSGSVHNGELVGTRWVIRKALGYRP